MHKFYTFAALVMSCHYLAAVIQTCPGTFFEQLNMAIEDLGDHGKTLDPLNPHQRYQESMISNVDHRPLRPLPEILNTISQLLSQEAKACASHHRDLATHMIAIDSTIEHIDAQAPVVKLKPKIDGLLQQLRIVQYALGEFSECESQVNEFDNQWASTVTELML